MLAEEDLAVDAGVAASALETESETGRQGELEATDYDATEYETVVRGKRVRRQESNRAVTNDEIAKIPGTHGDALIGVQSLPGIARTPLLSGLLFIRGSTPQDSAYLIDSLSALRLYHFSGVNSIFNSDLIEDVEYYPGNFPVRYGRAIGGVIDVNLRAPRTDRFHAYIDADLWDVGVLGEGPVSENWSVAVSARRSYIDGILKGIDVLEEQLAFTALPRYYDFQIIADYHPHKKDGLKLLVFGSDDKVALDMQNTSSVFNTSLNMHTYIYKAQLEWHRRISSDLTNQLDFGFGYWGGKSLEGSLTNTWHQFPLNLREEIAIRPNEFFKIKLGTDTNLGWTVFESESSYLLYGDRHRVNRFYAHPALYGELVLTAIPKAELTYGVRADYHSSIRGWGVDPRFSFRYTPLSLTTFKGGLGLYQKPPDVHQADSEYGNPNLDLSSAVHYSVGVEQQIPRYKSLSVDVEGFYKDVHRLVVGQEYILSPESISGVGQSAYSNTGTGKVLGLEILLRHKPSKYFFGWISYTLMKSEQTDYPDARSRPSDYDQTHVLNVIACFSIGWNIDIGARFRLASGVPYTPIVSSRYNADADYYESIPGERNSARMPTFHQLDLRIDKKWQWEYLAATVYLDVQNVYNHYNPMLYSFNFDGTQKTAISDLPILPSLGLKLEY